MVMISYVSSCGLAAPQLRDSSGNSRANSRGRSRGNGAVSPRCSRAVLWLSLHLQGAHLCVAWPRTFNDDAPTVAAPARPHLAVGETMPHHRPAVGHDRPERDRARHEWWRREFARESGFEWTEQVERWLKQRLAEMKRDAGDDCEAWELWEDLVDVLGKMEVLISRSKPLPDAVNLPQPNVAWLRYFIATFPRADLEAGLRRNEDGDIVNAPPFGHRPQKPPRLNNKETDPVSRTTLILAMTWVLDRLSWALPKTPGATRAQIAKEYGGWNDRMLALASLLLGNRRDEAGTPEDLLLTELESIRSMHRRQLAPTEPVRVPAGEQYGRDEKSVRLSPLEMVA